MNSMLGAIFENLYICKINYSFFIIFLYLLVINEDLSIKFNNLLHRG